MSEAAEVAVVTAPDGTKYPVNKGGRPKGSRNKITLLKIVAEEAARERNHEKMQHVIDLVVDMARRGDAAAQKLVWSAVMSNGIPTDQRVSEKVEININTTEKPEEKEVCADLVFTPTLVNGDTPNTPDEDSTNDEITIK